MSRGSSQTSPYAGDRGHRDAEHHGRLARVDASTAAGEDALNAPFASRDHLRRGSQAADQAVQVRPGLSRRDADREQAPARHNAVPNPGQLGDYRLHRPIVVSHDDS
jgi:hypothetical protein